MPLPCHPYGSWLFVPGDDSKKLCKALTGDADVVIFDLEDAVAPPQKDVARSVVLSALRKEARLARFVRVNDLSTGRTAEDVAETIAGPSFPSFFMIFSSGGPPGLPHSLVENSLTS
ncbi:MAG: aldolase/citrate lyase family protein, partial [Pseudomonadota bacterium]|nr:aldolase/citrate lyase family protein [Pseudomonadota bacterium]